MTRLANPLVGIAVLALLLVGCQLSGPSVSAPSKAPSSQATSSFGGSATESPQPDVQPPAPGLFPSGLNEAPSAQIYLESDGALIRIDLRTHTVQRIATQRLDQFRNFVATRHFLVTKGVDDDAGFLVTPDGTVSDLPRELAGRGRLYQAGPDRIWLVAEDASNGERAVSLFRTEANDVRLVARRSIPESLGIPWSDMAGQLIAQGPTNAYVVTQTSTRRLRGWRPAWKLLGIGRTTLLARTCASCGVTLRSRNGARTRLPATARGLRALDTLLSAHEHGADGLLSASGRYVAIPVTMKTEARESRLALIDLASGRTSVIPGSLARTNGNDQFAWLSQTHDRWLLVVGDHTFRVVDTKTGAVSVWSGVYVDRISVTTP